MTLYHWLFQINVLPLSGIEWSMKNAKRGYAVDIWARLWPVSSWMDKHISTHRPPPPEPLTPSYWLTLIFIFQLLTGQTLPIYPCHRMYFGILYEPLDPFWCSNMLVMAPHSQQCSNTSQDTGISFHHVIFHCQIYHTHSMCDADDLLCLQLHIVWS